MSNLVTIYGGSGFLGRYIARRMAKQGWRVRVAVRHPNEALFVRPYGVVGQVEPVLCNIRDDASVQSAMAGADAVVNCVGILSERGRNKFEEVQAEGAGRVARIAAQEGVARLVHVSAIGADENAESDYSRTKAMGETAVLGAFPGAVILRPSVMFGPEDSFFNRFAGLTRFGPVLPTVGARTKFQPVYVDDVAQAAAMAIVGAAEPGLYELGGPDVKTMRELLEDMLAVIHRRRLVLNLPFWMASIDAGILDLVQKISGGLVHNSLLTKDQVRSLKVDNVVGDSARTFADLNTNPVDMASVLPDYLWRFRPSGQYDAIKDSARNLGA